MKMTKIYIAVLATVAIAAPSTAFRPGDNWAPGAPGSGPPNANRDPDHIVCQVRGVTGSRARSVRICMTNAQWADLRDTENRDADTLIFNGTRSGCRNPGASGAVNAAC
ncbi:hypothetical protein [Parasphingopyxis marina]|uniref:Uncharacterized protein n=1 Tax=Parasphingopyxis marina TaxID=2761622 RepID=A0A842HX82_9SPHN|nr:hypothetical protein [Parasphingopyxis marina]MBC2776124.1 hypothetical protein [Parasphingopyxis marina]